MNAPSNLVSKALTSADADCLDIIELLFFAYRDFTSDPDAILEELDFGRAHHRVIHFVNRKPGLTVAELLDILKITKQSLARVLKQLIDTGYIAQIRGVEDKRQRELYPTVKGRQLALSLAAPQSRRIRRALREIGSEQENTVRRFLSAMAGPGNGTAGAGRIGASLAPKPRGESAVEG
jgi:DNA-binding MarR family transcriptional regulator